MNSFAESLAEIQGRCFGKYSLSDDDRALIHNAYWSGNAAEISAVLEIMCFDPDDSDMPMLLDASSPGSLWIHRCDAAQAMSGLDDGAKILQIMLERETHTVVRFYVLRELIDLDDDSVTSLLDCPIPGNGSPIQRSLWIYGNFERESISSHQAMKFLTKLMDDPKRRHEWLRDHIEHR